MIKRLLLLNGLSIVGVVCSHAAQWMWIVMFWWTDRYRAVTTPNYDLLGTLPYYGVVTLQKLGVFAVPAFLFATGFFVAYADRGKRTVGWKVVGTRLKNLLIPYTIWSVIIFIGDSIKGDVYSLAEYAKRLLLGEAVPAYFYVFVLCQLYLLAPLLTPLARKHSRALLIGSAALLVGVIGVLYWKLYLELAGIQNPVAEFAVRLVPSRLFVRWVFFFSLGMASGFHLDVLKRWLARVKWMVLGVVVVSFPLAVIETEWIFQATGMEFDWRGGVFTVTSMLYVLSFIFTFLAFEQVNVPLAKVGQNLGRSSFGIYLIHTTALEFAARAAQQFLAPTLAYPVLFHLALVAAAVAIPMGMMAVVTRSPARAYYRYLFG